MTSRASVGSQILSVQNAALPKKTYTVGDVVCDAAPTTDNPCNPGDTVVDVLPAFGGLCYGPTVCQSNQNSCPTVGGVQGTWSNGNCQYPVSAAAQDLNSWQQTFGPTTADDQILLYYCSGQAGQGCPAGQTTCSRVTAGDPRCKNWVGASSAHTLYCSGNPSDPSCKPAFTPPAPKTASASIWPSLIVTILVLLALVVLFGAYFAKPAAFQPRFGRWV